MPKIDSTAAINELSATAEENGMANWVIGIAAPDGSWQVVVHGPHLVSRGLVHELDRVLSGVFDLQQTKERTP